MTPQPKPSIPSSRRPLRIQATLCVTAMCAGLYVAPPSHARQAKPRPAPHAASTPSTAQILAPSRATVPDALPVDRAVYRCGNSYSPHPCADARPLDVADARTDAQRRQAEELITRDKRLAQWMEAGRRERDAPASEPAKRRSSAAQCVDTATMVCRPRKPHPRRSISKAASAAAAAARLSPD